MSYDLACCGLVDLKSRNDIVFLGKLVSAKDMEDMSIL